jgi:hypothetical protein
MARSAALGLGHSALAVLGRLPAWATTGVGSLPFANPRAAAAHAAGAYDVPFCPQLLALEGDMLNEWLGGDPQRCGWSADRDRQRPLAWDELLDELALRPPAHRVVKLQVTGPVTLACALERRAARRNAAGPSHRSVAALAREVATWVAANAAAWIATLAQRGFSSVLVVDEPALQAAEAPGLETAWDPLRAAAPAWGLHVCCEVPWALVGRAEPDLLSFDVAVAPPDPRALRDLLARGTRIAWGVLAPHRADAAPQALARLAAIAERVEIPGEQSLLTPACGSGRVPVHREHVLAAALAETASTLRAARSS